METDFELLPEGSESLWSIIRVKKGHVTPLSPGVQEPWSPQGESPQGPGGVPDPQNFQRISSIEKDRLPCILSVNYTFIVMQYIKSVVIRLLYHSHLLDKHSNIP